MSKDDVEQVLPGWQSTSQAVAHPNATLTEIEDGDLTDGKMAPGHRGLPDE